MSNSDNWSGKQWWIHVRNGEKRRTVLVEGNTKSHARTNWEKLKEPADTFVKIKKAHDQ